MKWLKTKLGITHHEQWYRVSYHDFLDNQGSTLLQSYGSFMEPIMKFFPNYDWKEWLFPKAPDGFGDVLTIGFVK